MTELLTAPQMREIEQAAIDSGAVTGLELMERAGQGAVDAILTEWPELADGAQRAVVLCGPGNNGGDGFVVARVLKARGWDVEVFLYGEAGKLKGDARTNYARWAQDDKIVSLSSETLARSQAATDLGSRQGVVIDAVFGTGLSRPLEPDAARALSTARSLVPMREFQFVSLDCLSGFCCDSGRPLGDESLQNFPVDLCISFHRPKLGHYIGDLSRRIKAVRVVDIGLDDLVDTSEPAPLQVAMDGLQKTAEKSGNLRFINEAEAETSGGNRIALEGAGRVALIRGIDREIDKGKTAGLHKFTHGHALILSGGVGRGGAARMAARGALRIGAGLVTVGCPPAAVIENAAQLDAIMLRSVRDGAALTGLLEDDRIGALCLGPGLGLDDRARELVAAALPSPSDPSPAGEGRRPAATSARISAVSRGQAPRRAVVLDGDALTHLAHDASLFARLHERCVLTPHGGEFARLFPDIAEKLDATPTEGPAYSKVDATRAAAARAGCVVVFKGPDTVIAAPDGRAAVNAAAYERRAPWLATAGSGDVLAGFVAGLLARGLDPMQAAEAAAWLHVDCALRFGPGLIAEDLPEQLPEVFRDLGMV